MWQRQRRRCAIDSAVTIESRTAGSIADGLANLNDLVGSAEPVALVAADLHLPDGEGVDFLEQAAGLHRGVARILLFDMDEFHTRIPFRELPALQRASALGRIDGWMVKNWVNPEEWLYPLVQEALSAWSTAHQSRHLVYRVVGEQWDPRSHDLRDGLTVNGVPFAFHTGERHRPPADPRPQRGRHTSAGGDQTRRDCAASAVDPRARPRPRCPGAARG